MKIKMLKSTRRSPDNRQLVHYDAGQTYDVPKDLADSLIAEKLAEVVDAERTVDEGKKSRAK